MKLYTVAGTSVLKGKRTYRFANSMSRAGVLARNGHTDVRLTALPAPMTRASAIAYLDDVQFVGYDVVAIPTVKVQARKESVLWRSLSPAQRADAQFEIWRYQAQDSHQCLVD